MEKDSNRSSSDADADSDPNADASRDDRAVFDSYTDAINNPDPYTDIDAKPHRDSNPTFGDPHDASSEPHSAKCDTNAGSPWSDIDSDQNGDSYGNCDANRDANPYANCDNPADTDTNAIWALVEALRQYDGRSGAGGSG